MSNEAMRTIARAHPHPTAAQVKAAKAHAAEHGYEGRTGGWIYNAKGRAVAHGWTSFTQYLLAIGIHAVRDAEEVAR